MSDLFNGCVAVLNIATSSCLIESCRVIYKTNTAFIRTRTMFFKQQHDFFFVPGVKFSPSAVNYFAAKKPFLLSFFQIAGAVETKKIFCEA